MVNFSLEGKIALVTGASYGIGFGIASAYAEAGATICFNDLSQEKVDKGIAAYKEIGVDAHGYVCDVTDEAQVQAMVAKINEEVGIIDILVNNAGITKDGLMLRMKENDFDTVIDVNLKGTWNCMKHATKLMMKQKYGRIVSMSSVVGVMGNAGQVNYAASKSGIIGMTMSLAREVGSRGITVNAVAPGFIQTAMTDVLSDEIKEQMKSQIPLGTFGSVQDIANAVVFLASDEAKYITGQTLHVDGGMAM